MKINIDYCSFGYQHFFRILRHFITRIGIVDWSQISNISVEYWSTITHEPAEITTYEHIYEENSTGFWVLVDQYFAEIFEICDQSAIIPIHALKCRKILKKCW